MSLLVLFYFSAMAFAVVAIFKIIKHTKSQPIPRHLKND
jgi:hypothetical protein